MCRCLAATSGSVGTANGSLSMITHDNCSPRTSTPCQKLAVANSTAFGVSRNCLSSCPLEALPWTRHGYSISLHTFSNNDCMPAKLVDSTNARPSVALRMRITSSGAALVHSRSRGSGISEQHGVRSLAKLSQQLPLGSAALDQARILNLAPNVLKQRLHARKARRQHKRAALGRV